MAEFFELSIVYKEQPNRNVWEEKFKLRFGKSFYKGNLDFYNGREVILNEFSFNEVWEYEVSTSAVDLFTRENIVEKIKELLEAVDKIMSNCQFGYGIGNIETNGTFISSNMKSLNPSKEMILKSTLIFLPISKLQDIEININHIIFEKGMTVCLFNPISGVLYSSQNEKYKILKESWLKDC